MWNKLLGYVTDEQNLEAWNNEPEPLNNFFVVTAFVLFANCATKVATTITT